MTGYCTAKPNPDIVTRLTKVLSGGSFAAFAICALFFYQVFVAAMAFAPTGTGAWNEFAEDFRLLCFRYSKGGLEMSSVWVMLSEPLPLQAPFFFIWRGPLLELWRKRRRTLFSIAGSAMLLISTVAANLFGLGRAQTKNGELPFPADRLRNALPMPEFALTNQDGESVSPSDFKGRVVLVTAIYSTCATTCPMMLTKIRTVLDQLTSAERNDLSVLAFSLNPEADTRELRKMIARIYRIDSPRFHFVNGVPSDVNAILDQLSVVRKRDEKTGQIVHSNLFFLLDREGRIAYRLSLSENEQSWLTSALRVLLAEKSS